MSEIKNGRLGLYGAEHLKCNHIVALVFKGLIIFVEKSGEVTASVNIIAQL